MKQVGWGTLSLAFVILSKIYGYELVPCVGSIYDTKHTIITEVTMN